MTAPLSHLARCLPEPRLSGVLKSTPDDFCVEEVLGFSPEGSGSHGLFWIEKIGTTTPQMIGRISRLARVAERDIGFCGLKDKHAVTRQWISLPLGTNEPDWFDALPEGVRVLDWARHPKKLRRGIHRGNRFTITLRGISGEDPDFSSRLERLATTGFANYFAEQRFGTDARNLDLLARLGATIESGRVGRSDRNWGISTLRALIFNEVLSRRIQADTVAAAQEGDLAQLAGSNSRFLVTADEVDHAQARIHQRDIRLTGPLWGAGTVPTEAAVRSLETALADEVLRQFSAEGDTTIWSNHLSAWRVDHDRRALMAPLMEPVASFEEGSEGEVSLRLSFTLASGSYATAVLRELVQVVPA
ncbi:hypothetical protein A9404_04195 [Halothiobacillus diazotrophicus]|uniref:tRNA pseudouridine synthase D n=1 Tax=Halothiobacillus diazotrophicus TaxID=1860122 RepID=A0A191ZFQ1_9GAMM|nr:hypothetical protein A9404_04195 [Halothiobacillus diazotrophicus]